MKNKKTRKPKEKFRYCFPNIMSKAMKKVSMRVQMESSMFSMFMIMIAMILLGIYLIFFTEGSIVYKVLILINLFFGFIFISSFLVTTYHQYINYMEVMNYDPDKERQEVKARGNIFKRIYLAVKENKKRKQRLKGFFPSFVEEAMKSAEQIGEERTKDMENIRKKAEELKNTENLKQKQQEIDEGDENVN